MLFPTSPGLRSAGLERRRSPTVVVSCAPTVLEVRLPPRVGVELVRAPVASVFASLVTGLLRPPSVPVSRPLARPGLRVGRSIRRLVAASRWRSFTAVYRSRLGLSVAIAVVLAARRGSSVVLAGLWPPVGPARLELSIVGGSVVAGFSPAVASLRRCVARSLVPVVSVVPAVAFALTVTTAATVVRWVRRSPVLVGRSFCTALSSVSSIVVSVSHGSGTSSSGVACRGADVLRYALLSVRGRRFAHDAEK
ncbi:hypothetical protein B1756_00630 [Natrarchaeobaculum aegyptiacum]|uniref:Uncharacterized protein n=1 Tax=Natrarchaeobaculum aegyptiacum TaxID=745377 RepID=A0A2Z2HPC4_9EURY|nr:hypothetical protein B1756_00630 [Natrarchaeobaculum aegyptiacum]